MAIFVNGAEITPLASSLASSVASKELTSFASDTDLTATVPTNGKALGRACRSITINAATAGAGTLTVKFADGSQDTRKNLSAGTVIYVQAVSILASGTSNITSVTVDW